MTLQNKLILPLASLAVVLVSVLGLYANGYFGNVPLVIGAQKSAGVLKLETPRSVAVNQPFIITVSVDTQGSRANAVGVYLRYDPKKLQLLNLDTRSSFCQFYPEKKYDNNLGTISLACGSPHPGMSGSNSLMTLQFMPLVVGNTTVYTDSTSQILLSDGKGTNILKEFPVSEIHVSNNL